MKNKIFITILLLVTLSGCGFSPIYIGSSKQVIISKSEIIGDKDLTFSLEQKLNFKRDEKDNEIKLCPDIDSPEFVYWTLKYNFE